MEKKGKPDGFPFFKVSSVAYSVLFLFLPVPKTESNFFYLNSTELDVTTSIYPSIKLFVTKISNLVIRITFVTLFVNYFNFTVVFNRTQYVYFLTGVLLFVILNHSDLD